MNRRKRIDSRNGNRRTRQIWPGDGGFAAIPWRGDQGRSHQILLEREDHGDALVVEAGLHLEQIGAQFQRAADAIGLHRLGQDHHGEPAQLLLPQPFEHGKAIADRHFQIKEQQIGEGGVIMTAADCRPAQPRDGFVAISGFGHDLQAICPAHGGAKQETVVRRIISNQNPEDVSGLPAHNRTRL